MTSQEKILARFYIDSFGPNNVLEEDLISKAKQIMNLTNHTETQIIEKYNLFINSTNYKYVNSKHKPKNSEAYQTKLEQNIEKNKPTYTKFSPSERNGIPSKTYDCRSMF